VAHLTVKTAVIGIVGALVAWTLYRLFTSPNSSAQPQKMPPVPRSALNAQGFIRIDPSCIPLERSSYGITAVKIIVEDTQGRRILTRYMPNLEEHGEILSPLPHREDVQVRLKITREDPARLNSRIVEPDPIRFTVDQQIGRYHIQPTSSLSLPASIRMEELDFRYSPLYRVSGVTHDGSNPTFKPLGIELQELGKIEGRFYDLKPNTLTLVNTTMSLVRVAMINFRSNASNLQLKNRLSYPLYPNQTRKLELRWLVQDWKAALKLEGQKSTYKEHRDDASQFYVENVTNSSYLVQTNPVL
jgi:hypothetical protein